MIENLQSRLKSVILSIGDIVVDCVNNDIGILVRRTRQFDIMLDELYLWEVRWINKANQNLPMMGAIEEESLEPTALDVTPSIFPPKTKLARPSLFSKYVFFSLYAIELDLSELLLLTTSIIFTDKATCLCLKSSCCKYFSANPIKL